MSPTSSGDVGSSPSSAASFLCALWVSHFIPLHLTSKMVWCILPSLPQSTVNRLNGKMGRKES